VPPKLQKALKTFIFFLLGLETAGQAKVPEETASEEETIEEESDIGIVASNSLEDVGTKLGQHIIGLSPLTVLPPKTNETPESIDKLVGDEEPTALIKQRFIFNEEITVEQFLKNSNANVLDFIRFESGEDAITD